MKYKFCYVIFYILIFCFPIARAEEGLYEINTIQTKFDQNRVAQAVFGIHLGLQRGTVFFVSADGDFVTNLHVIESILKQTGRGNLISNFSGNEPVTIELPRDSFLVNSEMNLKIPISQISLVFTPKQNLLWKLTQQQAFAKDFIVARVNYIPPTWLEFASTGPVPGERIYTFGYPSNTMRLPIQTQFGITDNANGSLRVSTGVIQNEYSSNRLYPLNKDNFVSNADGNKGSSGSPTLNEQGKVVGVLWGAMGGKDGLQTIAYQDGGVGHVSVREMRKQFRRSQLCKYLLSE